MTPEVRRGHQAVRSGVIAAAVILFTRPSDREGPEFWLAVIDDFLPYLQDVDADMQQLLFAIESVRLSEFNCYGELGRALANLLRRKVGAAQEQAAILGFEPGGAVTALATESGAA